MLVLRFIYWGVQALVAFYMVRLPGVPSRSETRHSDKSLMQIVIVFIMNKAYQDTVPLAWIHEVFGIHCFARACGSLTREEPETFQEKSTGWMLTQVLQSGLQVARSTRGSTGRIMFWEVSCCCHLSRDSSTILRGPSSPVSTDSSPGHRSPTWASAGMCTIESPIPALISASLRHHEHGETGPCRNSGEADAVFIPTRILITRGQTQAVRV